MKFLNVIVIFLVTLSLNAQVDPIETIENGSSKINYYSSNHSANKVNISNQGSALIISLSENLVLDSTPDISFISSCINSSTFSSIDRSKTIFILEHVVDQTGKVLSVGFTNFGIRVQLSNQEVNCILSQAMNNTFNFVSKPSSPSSFRTLVKIRYKFE